MIQLDKRTDRIFPNGWCTLPPKQLCDKGNACMTCPKFVTDASHESELRRQLKETTRLIEVRQQAFVAKFGAPMEANNVWLKGCNSEANL